MSKLKRRKRRIKTRKIAAKRLAEHLFFNPCCDADTCSRGRGHQALFWASRGLSCACRKRRHGQPKLSSGGCTMHERLRVYAWRRDNRRINNLIATQGVDPLSDEVNILVHPRNGRVKPW